MTMKSIRNFSLAACVAVATLGGTGSVLAQQYGHGQCYHGHSGYGANYGYRAPIAYPSYGYGYGYSSNYGGYNGYQPMYVPQIRVPQINVQQPTWGGYGMGGFPNGSSWGGGAAFPRGGSYGGGSIFLGR